MRILLAVDGSECGLRAAGFLLRLLDELGSIAGMALGSVATRVLHLAEVPVTVAE